MSGAPASAGRRPSVAVLLWSQARYHNRLFWRSPMAAFFTIAFPLIMLLVFTTLFGNRSVGTGSLRTAQFYAPSLGVYGSVAAAYTNLAIATVSNREAGILKRIRGTPLPPWVYIAGRLLATVWAAFLAVVVMVGVGALLYGIRIPLENMPAALVGFAAGVACFAALGLMVSAFIPDSSAAPAITNATLLPLAFISDVFIPPTATTPGWLARVADFFPLKHFAHAFGEAFNPLLTGNGFAWSASTGHYAIGEHVFWLAVWGIVATVVAARRFRWEPRAERGKS